MPPSPELPYCGNAALWPGGSPRDGSRPPRRDALESASNVETVSFDTGITVKMSKSATSFKGELFSEINVGLAEEVVATPNYVQKVSGSSSSTGCIVPKLKLTPTPSGWLVKRTSEEVGSETGRSRSGSGHGSLEKGISLLPLAKLLSPSPLEASVAAMTGGITMQENSDSETQQQQQEKPKRHRDPSRFVKYVSESDEEADTLKDKFWRDFDVGLIDTSADMYSKVRGRC